MAVDPVILRAFNAAASLLATKGARIVEVDTRQLLSRAADIQAHGSITAIECADLHRDVLATRETEIDRRVVKRIHAFSNVTGPEYARMLRLRVEAIAAATKAFLPFDAVILPTSPIFAPIIADLQADDDLFARTNLLALRNTMPFNLFDCCGLSLPMPDTGPLPAGFMMIGANMTDARLFAAGLAVKQVFSDARG